MIARESAEAARQIDEAIVALCARYGLPADGPRRLRGLVDLIADDPHAPTTVTDRARIVDEHLADSLVALDVTVVRTASRIADLGSGGGFPGLPLAIALPQAAVALVESSARKCAFIERAVTDGNVVNAEVVHTRAEAWPDGVGSRDLVTARALSAPDVVVEYAAPLLVIGGAVVLWRGRRDPVAEAAAARAAALLGLEVGPVIPVHPFSGAEHRHLHLFTKVASTPERFPRRPGMARKRPLGHGV